MTSFVTIVIVLIAAILLILFLNRYFRKATREVALVRTGLGGQLVVLDGGCIAVPFLHKISEINMRTSKLEIERVGPKSVITKDRLRVDVGAEFYVRVDASDEGVATAAQALAGKTFRASDLADTLEGKLVDAVLSVAAGYSMDELQDQRGAYTEAVAQLLKDDLAQNGLVLESVSLTRLDQTPFQALDQNNAFNALGMRRLAEIIAVNKKERAEIEADADVSVRQSELDATKRKLVITQEEEEALIAQQREIETARAKSQADIAEEQAASEKRREAARIEREREVRRQQLEAELSTETVRSENVVKLAAKRIEQAVAEAEAQRARTQEVEAEAGVETAKQTAEAERQKHLAVIKAQEAAEVDDTRVASEAGTVIAMAQAEAKATLERAEAEKTELLAKAEGTAALVAAENEQTPELMRLKLDQDRLRALPRVVENMLKPAEKIDSIRINHITGMGGATGGAAGEGADKSAINQAVDGVLNMALQLPAVKKLGEEVGLNIADGVEGLNRPLSDDQDPPTDAEDKA
ncbi:MAG: flotillin domain-containing protein [Pseudomonadota bacterium]